MRRVILNRIAKRLAYGLAFILASYAMIFLGIQQAMLNVRFDAPWLDFIYVLFVTFFPEVLQWIGYGVIFSITFLLLRYFALPIHRLERRYLGLRGGNFFKSVFIVGLVVLVLFIVPYFMRAPAITGDFVAGADQASMGVSSGFAALGGYLGLILGTLTYVSAGVFNFFVIKPFYLFYPVRLDAFIAAALLAPLFYHTALVSLSRRHIMVSRNVSKRLCQQGEKIVVRTSLRSPFPTPGVSIPSTRIAYGKVQSRKMKSNKNLPCTFIENTEEFALNDGYYNMDIVPVTVFTPPFFSTKLYKVCDENCDISVVPNVKFKSMVYIRRPSVTRDTGSLVRQQLGSSMDFADLRQYVHGDPLSRIWWKSLAKQGEMLVKQFHSFAEDRWMLVLDFTNQNLPEAAITSMLQFSRLFIELCTRKDIAIGLSTFSPTFHYIDYETKKRDLLSGLTKVTMPLHEVSPRGVEMILKDALGDDMPKLERKCRHKHMTLSMAYSYSGLGKRKSYLSWKGENVFKNSMRKFFINLHRSGKIIMVTDGNLKNMDLYKRFKAICEHRRCGYLFVLTGATPEAISQLKRAEIKHIIVPYDKLAKPGFVMGLVSLM